MILIILVTPIHFLFVVAIGLLALIVVFTINLWIFYLKDKLEAPKQQQFLLAIAPQQPMAFKNVDISIEEIWGRSSGSSRIFFSFNSRCNVYILNDYIAIFRWQSVIFTVHFPPIYITSRSKSMQLPVLQDIYFPDKVMFKQSIKGELEVRTTSVKSPHIEIFVRLKGLTEEELGALEKMKDWIG